MSKDRSNYVPSTVDEVYDNILNHRKFDENEGVHLACDFIQYFPKDIVNLDQENYINDFGGTYGTMPIIYSDYLAYKIVLFNPKLDSKTKAEIEAKLEEIEPEAIHYKTIYRLSFKLKNLRAMKELSTEALSKLSGVSGALINKIENCKITSIPKQSTLIKLAQALAVDIIHLIPAEAATKRELSKDDLKALLVNLGYKAKYASQIIDYADTIMIKQKIEEGEINV